MTRPIRVIILHVHDAADPQGAAQAADVRSVLADLGVRPEDEHVIEVFNKIDLLDPAAREAQRSRGSASAEASSVAVSAITGEGIDDLLTILERKVAGALAERTLTVPASRLRDIGWLYEHTTVEDRIDAEDGSVTLTLSYPVGMTAELDRRFPPSVSAN